LLDADGDGHLPPVCGGDDCDDSDPTTYPGAYDVCDGADNDCDGIADRDSPALSCASDRVCVQGTCVCGMGLLACQGRCRPEDAFKSDVFNCGGCGNRCGLGMTCSNGACSDIDECAAAPGPCGPDQSCANTPGSFTCSCASGYLLANGSCSDVDECSVNHAGCDDSPDACVNTPGSFSCVCPAGYTGDGVGSNGCTDADECTAGTDTCDHAISGCVNTVGSFACKWRVSSVVAAEDHTCAVLGDHTLKCWGYNHSGELGLGDSNDRGDQPGEMGNSLPGVALGTGRSARAVAIGGGDTDNGHTCALLDDGSIKCWGNNGLGQLGLGDTTSRGRLPNQMGDSLAAVALGTGRSAKALVANSFHTCALLDNDTVKCWGGGAGLGIGDVNNRGDQPSEMGDNLPAVSLGTNRTAKALSAGGSHVCALLDDNSVKCWGDNSSGQLGLGDTNSRGDQANQMGDNLLAVALGTGRSVKAIAAGDDHTCALLDDNTVKCWGYNQDGELGLGDGNTRGDQAGEMGDNLPVVALGNGHTAQGLAAGALHSCVLLDDNTVKCWGYNQDGELGLGDKTTRGDQPGEMGASLPMVALGSGRTAKAITSGQMAGHTCALLDNDTIKCWGYVAFGRLGLGDGANNRGDQPNEMGDNLPSVDLGGP
jgi:alpha-tubulin suppressor-like RCC1 family protein